MTLANPGMKFGGFFNYSKFDVLKQIPQQYLPVSYFFETTPSLEEVKEVMNKKGLEYPIILKPDEGERGSGVEKLASDSEVKEYLKTQPENLILQEYITYSNEYGVMYIKYPSTSKSIITSVVHKGELFVVGDGNSDLISLFKKHPRAILYLDFLKEQYQKELNVVLDNGEVFMLSKMGNHCRGAIFNDANHLKDQIDIQIFDEISSNVEGFYFGRYDLKAKDEQSLLRGEFKIMELNGVNSEPAHIYDPKNSIINAYKDLFAHWWDIYRVSKENRQKGFRETSFPMLVQSLMER